MLHSYYLSHLLLKFRLYYFSETFWIHFYHIQIICNGINIMIFYIRPICLKAMPIKVWITTISKSNRIAHDLSRESRCNQVTRPSNLFCPHSGYRLTPLLIDTVKTIKAVVILGKGIFNVYLIPYCKIIFSYSR